METGVSVISGIFGVMVLLGLLLPGFAPSPSLNEILWPLVAAQGVFLAVGGALAFAGLQWAGEDVSTGWGLERFGWLVSAGGFLTYGAAHGVKRQSLLTLMCSHSCCGHRGRFIHAPKQYIWCS